jgi:hypothetical protein
LAQPPTPLLAHLSLPLVPLLELYFSPWALPSFGPLMLLQLPPQLPLLLL